MKRFFILLIFLLSLLSMITNGKLNVGVQIANAQSMGSEITLYQCEKSSGQYYFSTEPCDYELPEVYICSCKYCHQQMSCDVITFHTCFAKSQYNNGSPYPPPYDNGSSSGGSNGSGGGANIPIGGGNSTTNTDPNNNRDSRDYDFGNAPWPKKTINEGIFNQNLNDLLKGTLHVTQGPKNGTCGAVVLEKFLLDCYPQTFTEVAKSLYEVGHSHTWNLQLNSFDLTTKDCSNLGYNTVDAIFQTTIIQDNNYYYKNFSLNEMNENKEGTFSWKIKEFIQEHIGNTVGIIPSPSYDDIKNALNDNSNIFIIGFVDSGDDEDHPDNFGSSAYIEGNHFVQITNVTNGGLDYYSWGGNHHSDIANICVLYIVKRK